MNALQENVWMRAVLVAIHGLADHHHKNDGGYQYPMRRIADLARHGIELASQPPADPVRDAAPQLLDALKMAMADIESISWAIRAKRRDELERRLRYYAEVIRYAGDWP
ncbi:MAG: hypothetical protein VW338_00125 [Rhodospirillaceae bacterium]